MPHIEIRDVVKRFETAGGDIHAFGPATLAVDQGEFVSLVGPSGCGKSTLLLMIAGLMPPSEGEIRVDDRTVAGTRTDVGIMFQDNTLVAWRSVRRNVELQLELRGIDPRAHRDHIDQLLAAVGLED